MLGIAEGFAAREDPRRPHARQHKLLDILVIAFCASRCGAESGLERAGLAWSQEEVLREFLDLEGGPPSHDTFSRVFRLLDPASLAACWQTYLDPLGAVCRGPVALDGKTLRGAHDRAAGASPLPMVSAFASETRLTLGPIAVEAHSNEIPAVRALLSLLSLEGCTVTLDALPAPRETAPALRDQGADYLLALTGNQGTWCEDVRTLLDDAGRPVQDRAQTEDADQGRLETRAVHLVTDLTGLQEQHHWPGLACVGKLRATREDKTTGTVQSQERYDLLSRVRPAQEFLDTVRAHGAIENSLPGVLDVVMCEDHARARQDHAPANRAMLRRMARNTIKANQDKGSNRLNFKRAGWDDHFLRKLLAQC